MPLVTEVLELLEMPPQMGVSGLEADGCRRSVLLRRRKQREGESRPPAQARAARGRPQLQDPQRLRSK